MGLYMANYSRDPTSRDDIALVERESLGLEHIAIRAKEVNWMHGSRAAKSAERQTEIETIIAVSRDLTAKVTASERA